MKGKFTDLSHRGIIGSIIGFFILAMIYYSTNDFVLSLFSFFIALVAGMAAYELGTLAKIKDPKIHLKTLFFLSTLLTFSFASRYRGITVLLFFIFFIFFFIQEFRSVENALFRVSFSTFTLLYLSVPLGLSLWILQRPEGRMWLLYLLVVIKISDIAAYFIGKFFGKKKLAAVLSPKKTWEGAIGGFLFGFLASFAFFYLNKKNLISFSITFYESLFYGVLFPVLGQAGDLAESLIKRDIKVKDSSSIPGFGGILDMLDSLVFALIIFFFL